MCNSRLWKIHFLKDDENEDQENDKEDNREDYFIICKKQTCSPKLKNLEETENYIKNF